jgi:glycyl-tRNA synthetase (class II)
LIDFAYLFDSNLKGWLECVGLADRCDFDLKQHSDSSGQDLMIGK